MQPFKRTAWNGKLRQNVARTKGSLREFRLTIAALRRRLEFLQPGSSARKETKFFYNNNASLRTTCVAKCAGGFRTRLPIN